MPLASSSGGPALVPGRIATRSGVPATTTVRMPGSACRGMRSAAEDMAALAGSAGPKLAPPGSTATRAPGAASPATS